MPPAGWNGRLDDQPALDRAVEILAGRDPLLAGLYARHGMPALRRRPPGFAGLVDIILAQQVSTAAARGFSARLEAELGGAATPESVRRAGEEGLRRAGLSRPKIRALLGIIDRLPTGAGLDAIDRLEAEPARAALLALPGVGPWTAEVYLLFGLGWADAFPAGDLALQVAAAEALGHPVRLSAAELATLAQPWRPWRGAAAHLLWAAYAARRGRPASPV
ncbi:DNA-3-methyladenine glycosylase family protein [Ancylobacter lacus]|uniref:DNA-3-methyladenine glycosylase family protein n=1 Tax=Ancylobacter lacus TaxID=2579970 RepID=UPI001BCE382B|nr:DNA-3-methyladenine glycosylase 2 family protein [Ancylobacter lacus]MBS7537904.1 DNA-3-methyladenine glycosylase 2 family protein [Ancylobacter lacus]